MHDLMTKEEDAEAAAQGWGLYHVYELEVRQWVIRILPANVAPAVVGQARAGAPLPLRALRLMMNYKGR